MGLAVGAVTAGGRLHLVFRYRHPLLDPADVAGFADRYVTALNQVAAYARVTLTPDEPQTPGRLQHHRPVTRQVLQ